MLDLLGIEGEQLHAVRIDAAQIGGHQRGGDQFRFRPRTFSDSRICWM